MPCYEVNRVQVEFNLKNFELIKKAAESLGWEIRKTTATRLAVYGPSGFLFEVTQGNTSVRPSEVQYVNQLKRAYSKQALKVAAQKTGWTKQTRGKKEAFVKGGF